ncbi:MAG: WecB/TagA/CpsF family glycosyltransferase, partial [Pyrinomonadaceae bacterium]
AQLAANLQRRFSGLKIVGMYSPPFRPMTASEDDRIVSVIKHARPDIVWVGLSTPKQEEWMARHVERLNTVLIGVGAAFDFLAGTVKQAPRWMQRSGFEWLFRLLMEPKRLWRRYCTVVPLFLLHTFMQVVGLRKYSID